MTTNQSDQDLATLCKIVIRKGNLDDCQIACLDLAKGTDDPRWKREYLREFLKQTAMKKPEKAEELGVKPAEKKRRKQKLIPF